MEDIHPGGGTTPMSERHAALYCRCAAVLAVAAVFVGAGRVASTYLVFSHTFDEPAHIAAGMEWLDRGAYTYEAQHPPLARVAGALGPWLSGANSTGLPGMWEEGDAILHATGAYPWTLALARLGNLPFFLLASGLAWAWGRRLFGDGAALAATVLFTSLPSILAHASLATTDMAIAATLPLAVYVFLRWIERPSLGRCLVLGIAVAGSVLSKLSALVLLPSCVLAVVGWRWAIAAHQSSKGPRGTRDGFLASRLPGPWPTAVVACVALIVVWAGYRCSLISATVAAERPHVLIDRIVGSSGVVHDAAYAAAEARILPFSELVRGIADVAEHNAAGHTSYLLGRTSQTGWWLFFPIALLVKTPIAFLLLGTLGCIASLRASWRRGSWEAAVPALCAAAVLLAVLPSRIGIGLRHVLPICPFLAVAAGFGASWLAGLKRPKLVGRTAAALLLAWHLASGLVAHPDYLTYFNEVAGRQPDRILVDSDLDWGQDLYRLSETLRRLGATDVTAEIHGHTDWPKHDLTRHHLPAMRPFDPDRPPRGWLAVSVYWIRVDPRLSWLDACEPVAAVGRSIRIYRFPEDETSPSTEPAISGPDGDTRWRCRH